MVKYVCKNCNYNFYSSDADECRFCGMDTIVIEQTADELLDEVDKLLRE